MSNELQCWHKEIDEDGICKACGAKAAIRIDGLSTPSTQLAEARAQALKEAAEIARKWKEDDPLFTGGYNEACDDIAAALEISANAQKEK